jgi:hypothetical protein
MDVQEEDWWERKQQKTPKESEECKKEFDCFKEESED